MKIWGLLLLGITVTCAFAQTPLPPKHSANATSVSMGLQSVRDMVNAQGEISYTMISKSAVDGSVVEDHYTVETSHAVAHTDSCSLEVEAKMTMNGVMQRQGRVAIPFRPVTGVAVKSQTDAINEHSAKAGVTAWTGKIAPESYMVQTLQSGTLSGILFFRERAAAEEAAKTISRIVEQCGGVKVSF